MTSSCVPLLLVFLLSLVSLCSSSSSDGARTAHTHAAPRELSTLVVSAGEDKQIQLPLNYITLSAFALPKDDAGEYSYHWSLVTQLEGGQVGEMVGINTDTLRLTKLIEGQYTFKVAVSAENKYGEAYVNVTVLPPARQNQPPVAVVKPVSQQVKLPNDVVIDASESTDDDRIVSYLWETEAGPLRQDDIVDSTSPLLQLKALSPGDYRFKLTVTDSDGAQNSTFADVKVIKETDYPPKANAGSNQVIYLPQNSLILYGNASTDDKGIVSYEWTKKFDNKQPLDMTGVTTPFLHLENLQVGDYTFTLKVTDGAGQSATADVSVFVKPEHNQLPVAVAGPDRTVWLPAPSVTLNANQSSDDQRIVSYQWNQTKGGSNVIMTHADSPVVTLTGLAVGQYQFRLTVTDNAGQQASDTMTLTVKENANQPPKARAGGNRVVFLPAPLILVNGSESSDDKGIVSYLWTRDDRSLAAGDIVNASERTAILQVANMVTGRYVFKLCVTDAEGLYNTDTASIIVQQAKNSLDLVEIELDVSIKSFTQANKVSLENELALLLHGPGPKADQTQVHIETIYSPPMSDRVVAVFYAFSEDLASGQVVLSGPHVVSALKKKLSSSGDVLDFKVKHLDTKVCQNNCSGHGYCDQNSKLCVCEAFWMHNFFKAYFFNHESNCEWSVLYVIIICFILVVGLGALVWAGACLIKRWSRLQPKKRHRYSLLEDDNSKPSMELLPKGKVQSSSLMMSESDFSSDEETLFINKKTNGHVKNGLLKGGKNKLKT